MYKIYWVNDIGMLKIENCKTQNQMQSFKDFLLHSGAGVIEEVISWNI